MEALREELVARLTVPEQRRSLETRTLWYYAVGRAVVHRLAVVSECWERRIASKSVPEAVPLLLVDVISIELFKEGARLTVLGNANTCGGDSNGQFGAFITQVPGPCLRFAFLYNNSFGVSPIQERLAVSQAFCGGGQGWPWKGVTAGANHEFRDRPSQFR